MGASYDRWRLIIDRWHDHTVFFDTTPLFDFIFRGSEVAYDRIRFCFAQPRSPVAKKKTSYYYHNG